MAAGVRLVDEAEPGAVVLVDGDLQPDWRIPARWLAGLLIARLATESLWSASPSTARWPGAGHPSSASSSSRLRRPSGPAVVGGRR